MLKLGYADYQVCMKLFLLLEAKKVDSPNLTPYYTILISLSIQWVIQQTCLQDLSCLIYHLLTIGRAQYYFVDQHRGRWQITLQGIIADIFNNFFIKKTLRTIEGTIQGNLRLPKTKHKIIIWCILHKTTHMN